MTAREKIVKFMKGKLARMQDFNVKHAELYFNDIDCKIIMKWDESQAGETWNRIKDFVFDLSSVNIGLTGLTCPYCIYHNRQCWKCEYAVNHCTCQSDRSDYAKILDQYDEEASYLADVILTKKFYIDLIEVIERGNI